MAETRSSILSFFAAFLILTVPFADAYASTMQETKVRLQSDLQKHIYRSLVDGAYHTLDSNSGEVRKLYPHVSHPMILKMGEYYVMCADFRDGDGNNVDVDFYMIKRNRGYMVFRAEIDNHKLLDGLMKSGRAQIFQ